MQSSALGRDNSPRQFIQRQKQLGRTYQPILHLRQLLPRIVGKLSAFGKQLVLQGKNRCEMDCRRTIASGEQFWCMRRHELTSTIDVILDRGPLLAPRGKMHRVNNLREGEVRRQHKGGPLPLRGPLLLLQLSNAGT